MYVARCVGKKKPVPPFTCLCVCVYHLWSLLFIFIFNSIFRQKKNWNLFRFILIDWFFFLCFFSFDATKSTKGASKLRRDLINSEIANLRDLLPLPSSTRQRLSQLQLMALVCVYVRKANYFQYGKCVCVCVFQNIQILFN